MTIFGGQGDIHGSMGLLWRSGGNQRSGETVGRKASLSLDEIVNAGIAIADSGGLSALSMRSVGERLGRTAMALYTYVPSKGELVDLMYDHVLAELPTSYELASGWRAALMAWARDLCEFYILHPWVLQISSARPVLGPNEYSSLNTVLTILFQAKLEPSLIRRIVGLLFHCVRGSAQTISEVRMAPAATGVTDERWWADHSAALIEVAPNFGERYPMVMRLEAESNQGHDAVSISDPGLPHLEREARETFSVGLKVILDGLELATTRQNPLSCEEVAAPRTFSG